MGTVIMGIVRVVWVVRVMWMMSMIHQLAAVSIHSLRELDWLELLLQLMPLAQTPYGHVIQRHHRRCGAHGT